MRTKLFATIILALGLLPIAAGTFGGTLDSFTITDGLWSYSETNLKNKSGVDVRNGLNGGLADFKLNGGIDNLGQNWWWYRTTGDSREYGLSNEVLIVPTSNFGNATELLYYESLANGTIPNALEMHLRYTLTDLGNNMASLTINWDARNISNTSTSFDFFSYTDPDWGPSTVGTLINNNSIVKELLLTDTTSPRQLDLKAQSDHLVGWELATFPTIRNALTDGGVDNLTNSVTPFGPGDATAGLQWHFANLNPGDVASGMLTKKLTVGGPIIPEASALLLALPAFASLATWRRRRA